MLRFVLHNLGGYLFRAVFHRLIYSYFISHRFNIHYPPLSCLGIIKSELSSAQRQVPAPRLRRYQAPPRAREGLPRRSGLPLSLAVQGVQRNSQAPRPLPSMQGLAHEAGRPRTQIPAAARPGQLFGLLPCGAVREGRVGSDEQ